MNARYSLPILFLVLFSSLAAPMFAQKTKHRVAKEYFTTFRFEKAAEVYEDILKKNPEDLLALRQAGMSRIRTGDFSMAEQHFAKLVSLPESTDQDLLSYAYVLKIQKKYDDAVVVYERHLALGPDPHLEGYTHDDWATRITRDSARFEIKPTSINSENSDFAPAFADENKVVFSSARKQGKGKRKKYVWNDQSYLNLYTCEVAADSSLHSPSVMKNRANSRYHEGTVTYDRQHKIMYFTRNNILKGKKEVAEDGLLRLGIFYAGYTGDEIGKVKAFPFNEAEHSVGHPVISPDGKKMYFVSDMEGGYGGTDIYVSVRNLDFWSPPVNLGPIVNTPGNEMFPFMDETGTFYFASDYHPGLGGLDLFYANLEDSTQVQNFGYPINSSYDDFGMICYKGGLRGYYSSNRPGGMGDDDIYEYIIHPVRMLTISGRVFDLASDDYVPNAIIQVKNPLTGETMPFAATTDEEGRYRIELPFAASYGLSGQKNGYFEKERVLHADGRSAYVDGVDLYLVARDYAAEGTILLSDGTPAGETSVFLKSLDGKILEERRTDDDGGYFFYLDPNSSYIIEAVKEGYPPQSVTIETGNDAATVIHTDIRLYNYEKGTIVQLDNIYYNYDQATIRVDAQRDLDRLAGVLKQNPTMRVELRSHTDSRGTDAYNLRLSDRRAKAAVDYLIAKGISAKRLVWKGYGETELLNKCVNDTPCSEEEHQRNRRTEFKILDI